MRTVFFAFALFFASIMPALGSPLDLSYTHNTALTVPELSEPEASFHLAKTWFLPDWQAGLGSRTDTAPDGSGDLNGSDYTCEKTYNLNTSCTSPQIIEKTHNMGKITCYKCKCPDNYKTTSCKTGWHLSGTPCKIGTTSYYTGCAVDACPSGYTAGKTCGDGYTLEKSGQSGDQYCGKCVAKSCPSGYTVGLANCNGKTYPAGWTYSSNGYSGDSVCGKCTAKTCSSGTAGLANCNGKAQPSGWTYSSNGYAGDSVCGTCTAKSCPAGYTAGTTGCSNTTSWTYGSNGYAGDSICGKCTPKDCADGYTAGLANCNGKAHPAGWTYSTGTPSGSTVCGKCTAKTCSAGSTSCDTATQNATANGYYAGDSTCYTCTAKTCEQLGKKTCNGSCIATSECCGGCGNNQKCENGNCVASMDSCEKYLRSICTADNKCSFNGENINNETTQVILYGSQIFNLQDFNNKRIAYFESGETYKNKGVEDCKNSGMAKVQGTYNPQTNVSFYNIRVESGTVIEPSSNALIDFVTSIVFDLEIIGNNGTTVEFFHDTWVDGNINGINTQFVFYTAPDSSFWMRNLQLSGANSYLLFTGANLWDQTPINSSFRPTIHIDTISLTKNSSDGAESDIYNNQTLYFQNVALDIGTLEITTDRTLNIKTEDNMLNISNFILSNGGDIGLYNYGTINDGYLNIDNISVDNSRFSLFSYGAESVSSVNLNKSSYYQYHEHPTSGKAGSVSLSSGNYISIPYGGGTVTGSYSGSSFNSYKK